MNYCGCGNKTYNIRGNPHYCVKCDPPQCILCGTKLNLQYCGMCGKYFCPGCEKNYPERLNAALYDKVFDPIGDTLRSWGWIK